MVRTNNVRKITKFKRSIKAISPVIATLLMIAIAVVASLVVYAWVSGYMGFQTNKAGKAISLPSFTGVANDPNAEIPEGPLVVYVQNVGQGTVEVSAVYVDDELRNDWDAAPSKVISEGNTAAVTITGPFTLTEKHNIKVTTTDGTFMTTTGKPLTGGSTQDTTPTAVDDVYTVERNNVLSITSTAGVISNDRYINTVVTPATTGVSHGSLTLNADGSFTYTPTTDYTGDDSFTYTASGASATATVTIHVVNAPPALDHFEFTPITTAQVQGVDFEVTITAKDQYDGTLVGYTGINSLTVNSGTITPTSTTAFTTGVWTGNVQLSATGTVRITSTGNTKSGYIDITVNAPTTYYSVTFVKGDHGDVISPLGLQSYASGTEVQLSASALSGYHFSHWSSDTGSITFTPNANTDSAKAIIGADGTVTANFAQDAPTQYTVTPSAGSGGSISPSTAQTVNAGANSPEFTITANSNYQITDVKDGATSLGGAGQTTFKYTFQTVTANHQISATFEQIPITQTLILRPNSDGNLQLSRNAENRNYKCVDDTDPADGAGTFVYDNNNNWWEDGYDRDYYALTDRSGSETGTINSITVYINCREVLAGGSTAQSQAKTVLRYDDNNNYGNAENLGADWAPYHTTYTTRPGGGAWQWNDINSLQAGVSLYSADFTGFMDSTSSTAQCTQVWVVVTYTP